MDWKREIAVAYLVRQKVQEADVDKLWEYPLPELAATQDDIRLIEAGLGFSLDDELKEFFLHANGWRSILQSIDVFTAQELTTGVRKERADALMLSLEPIAELCGFQRSELLPFAVSVNDTDVFAISTPVSHEPGRVFWFAGGLVDRFATYSDWFLAMIDYNRRAYAKFVEKAQVVPN